MLVMILFFVLVGGRFSIGRFCNDGSNPCELDQPNVANSYFFPRNGYYCLDAFNGEVICTCPDNSTTRNKACRICNRDPNPCGVGPSVVTCTDINQSFSCLCNDGEGELLVTTKPCGDISLTPSLDESCDNDGVRDPSTNLCNCPSGFNGNRCEIRSDRELCNGIECKSNGICAIRPINLGEKVYQSKCLCRSGTDGEYCEKQNVLSSCTSRYCLNDGICQERHLGNSRYAICQCKAGWAGARCEKQYFRCESEGYFTDEFMKNQGKYFWCIHHQNDYLLKQNSCPKGLKFNTEKQLCLRQL